MRLLRRKHQIGSPGRVLLLAVAVLCWGGAGLNVAVSQEVTLYLSNGDRVTGVVLVENASELVISNTWAPRLTVPLERVTKREPQPRAASPATKREDPNPAVAKTAAPIPVTNEPLPPKTIPKRWRAEARIGADFILGAKERESYYGRLKLSYQHPFSTEPVRMFRNVLDYTADYARSEGEVTANRMDASNKSELDIGTRKLFLYNLGGVGYDDIRRIDLRWEVGPGIGYHLFTHTNFTADVEFGVNYQAHYRDDGTVQENFYYRLAENLTWKVRKQLTFSQKLDIFPAIDFSTFRARLEATLSYGIWKSVSLNLTLLDLYESNPAHGVPNNELQIRSSVGLTF